jgi:D-alanyl-D-alanine carboxypeptidase
MTDPRSFFPALALGAVLFAGAASADVAPHGFTAEVSKVRWADLRYSYRAGCPVGPAQLRTLQLSYWGFDGRPRVGKLVVNRRVTRDVVTVFRRLYAGRFPIRRIVPVSRYRGSDDASMAADNTSAFNCRFVSGTSRWSMHAYGLAIDVNPVENPYISGGRVSPPAGRRYVDRARVRPGMAIAGGMLVTAFASVGWQWGGFWTGSSDYQHFSTTGD